MKTLITLLALSVILLTSCGSNEYKPFDAGVEKIESELSLDKTDKEIQLRNINN